MSFTKADLKTGMILEFEQGIKGRVLLDTRYGDVVVVKGALLNLEDGYNENLTAILPVSKTYKRILKVYNPTCMLNCYGETEEDTGELVWERPEPKRCKVRQRFSIEGVEYTLFRVSLSSFCLINVSNGYRWGDATEMPSEVIGGFVTVSQGSLEMLIGDHEYIAL